jgi:hypothetical protein
MVWGLPFNIIFLEISNESGREMVFISQSFCAFQSNGLKIEGWINRTVTDATEVSNVYLILD